MALSQAQLDAIKTEIETNPHGDGYIVVPLPDQYPTPARSDAMRQTLDDVVDRINAPRGITVANGPATIEQVFAIVNDVAASLTTDQATKLNTILLVAQSGFDVSDAGNVALIDAAIPSATKPTQNAALKALASRTNGSRAEQLVGRNVTREEVATALYGAAR